jgi:hypothetical protein
VGSDRESLAPQAIKANRLNLDKQALTVLEMDLDRQRLTTLDKNTLIGLRKRKRVRKRLLRENRPPPGSNRSHMSLR